MARAKRYNDGELFPLFGLCKIIQRRRMKKGGGRDADKWGSRPPDAMVNPGDYRAAGRADDAFVPWEKVKPDS